MFRPDMVKLGCMAMEKLSYYTKEIDVTLRNSVYHENEVNVAWITHAWLTCTLHDRCMDQVW